MASIFEVKTRKAFWVTAKMAGRESAAKTKSAVSTVRSAKAKGVNDPTSFAMADLMLGLGASQELDAAVAGVELKCPRCGFSQADFKKSGRLGCPECYRTFAEGLSGLLKTMHKGTRHVGKAPEALRQSRDTIDRLKLLQKRLVKAVEDENYESAAALRDEIKLLGGAAVKSR